MTDIVHGGWNMASAGTAGGKEGLEQIGKGLTSIQGVHPLSFRQQGTINTWESEKANLCLGKITPAGKGT